MSTFDVAFGMDASTFNKGILQLFAKPEVRNKLFKGSKSQPTVLGTVTLSWDILDAPNFILAPPTDSQWNERTHRLSRRLHRQVRECNSNSRNSYHL